MRDGTRAARSAAVLAGLWLAAWLQVTAVLALVLLVLSLLPGSVALRIGAPLCIAAAGLSFFATSQALRVRQSTPASVPVTRADAPALWSMVDAAAAAARVAPPEKLLVVADAQVWVQEQLRLIGLVGGTRELYLGLPLLQVWDVPQLRAAVAHELAHCSPELGRFAPVAYRGRLALSRIVARLPRHSPVAPLLRAGADWFRRLDRPLAQAQELAADRIAAAFAAPEAVAAILRDGPALEGMQRLFHAEYVSPGWQAGYVPEDVFGGFLRVLAARADEMARLRALPPQQPDPWDSHPPVADRLAALVSLPDRGSSSDRGSLPGRADAADAQTAGEPVPDLPLLGRALQAVAFPPVGRTVVGWDDFFTVARNAELQREADAALRAIGRAAGAPVSGLADVLDLVADGRLPEAAQAVFGSLPHAETTERITDLITLLLALAALDAGVARWRHSWTGTAELVAIDGGYLDLAEPALLASDPRTVASARHCLTLLGIDPVVTRPVADRRPPRVPVLGGVLNLLAGDARTDLLIAESGFLLVESLPRFRNVDGRRRLVEIAAGGVRADGSSAVEDSDEVAAGGRFVPYTDIVAASTVPGRRRRCDLTLRDGTALTIRAGLDSDDLPGGWEAFDEAVDFLTRTRVPASSPAPATRPAAVSDVLVGDGLGALAHRA